MKILLLTLLLFVSYSAGSDECSGKVRGSESSIDEHIEQASRIYLGEVTNAYLVSDINKIVFELETKGVFKGRYSSHETLETTSYITNPDISIGHSYIFFLYDSNKVDFCGVSLDLGKQKFTLERLKNSISSFKEYEANILNKLFQLKNK